LYLQAFPAYPTVCGYAPALPANIRLGWKGLPGTNSLDYHEKNYDHKKFYNNGPWHSLLK